MAFHRAAERRFGENPAPEEIVLFVSELRTAPQLTDVLDPHIAERVLLAAVADEDISDVRGSERMGPYVIMLAAMIRDAKLSSVELDAFVDEVRAEADEYFARSASSG